MRTKNHQPNACQVRWREEVRDMGSIVTGRPAVIHHPVGQSARHNKVPVGNWWVLPLTDDEHRLLHSDMLEFERVALGFNPGGRFDCEKFLFVQVMQRTRVEGPPMEVYGAIMDYRR